MLKDYFVSSAGLFAGKQFPLLPNLGNLKWMKTLQLRFVLQLKTLCSSLDGSTKGLTHLKITPRRVFFFFFSFSKTLFKRLVGLGVFFVCGFP